jgi:hypothetical protein
LLDFLCLLDAFSEFAEGDVGDNRAGIFDMLLLFGVDGGSGLAIPPKARKSALNFLLLFVLLFEGLIHRFANRFICIIKR